MSYNYSSDEKTLISIPFDITHMIVESFVTTLGESCASNSKNTLSKVSFLSPSSLTTIYGAVFEDCVCIREIDFSNCTKLAYCKSAIFRGCTILEHVYFPDSLVYIDSRDFVRTSLKLLTIPSSLTRTGDETFANVTTLETIDFSRAVKLELLYQSSFMNTSVRVIDLRNCKKLNKISQSTFAYCSKLETIYLPCSTDTLSIHSNSFNNCTSLNKIVIPKCSSKMKIYSSAFNHCDSLLLPEGLIKHKITCNICKRPSRFTTTIFLLSFIHST